MAALANEVFKNLRGSFILLVLMIAAGAMCVFASTRLLDDERKAFNATKANVMELRSRLSKARDEEQDIKARLVRYEELLARGVIGEEERLDWVEQIRRIKSERKLYEIHYEIAPQKVVSQVLVPGPSGSFEFYASAMTVRMDLLHEEDLLHFIADLRGSIHAYLRVRQCDVQRTTHAESNSAGAALLQAHCQFDLITARERRSI